MHDYICRQDVFDVLNKYASEKYDAEINKAIQDIPTADVQPVVHGEWMPERAISLKLTAYRCTECRNIYTAMTRYCPACGAKMDGGNKMSTGNETLF